MGAIISVNQMKPAKNAVDAGVAVLAQGGVVLVPTDSVYGIACAAVGGNPAHQRIFHIKKRPEHMTLPWLIADAGDLMRFSATVTPAAAKLATAFWPGALTLVVEASDEVAPEYKAQDGSIALRLPNSTLVRELARRGGFTLATTSANSHGEEAASSGEALEESIVSAADLTLDAGPAPLACASTIVDVRTADARILRIGAISKQRIEAALS